MTTTIPKQLQKPEFRFCLIPRKMKSPYDQNWQTTANYRYDRELLQYHLRQGGNYGVLGGFGDLYILDCDAPEIEKLIKESFPPTFKVHKHYYFICKGAKSLKLLKGRKTYADFQGKGKQCVGGGSIHPDGRMYEIKQDLPIAEIDFKKVLEVFKEFIEKPLTSGKTINAEGVIVGKRKPTPITTAILKLLKLVDVMEFYGFDITRKYTQCLLHDSKGKHSFCWDNEKGVWFCQGCQRGGNLITLIRYCERLI